MPVGELLARTSGRELSEWAAYERVAGPLGPERGDLHTAIIAATIYNTTPGVKKPKKAADFVPEWDRRPQSAEEQLMWVKTLNRVYGGEEVTDGDAD